MKINEQVRQMYPPRYTTSQAAPLVGKSVDTLRRWRREGVYVPMEFRHFGQELVPLYTDQDIQKMRKIAKTIKPGRKREREPSGTAGAVRRRGGVNPSAARPSGDPQGNPQHREFATKVW